MVAAIFDIDGTLVDTNYQHALAWYRAFRQHDILAPIYRIHRHIGMGGDQLVPAIAGTHVEAETGDSIRAAERSFYSAMLPEVACFEGARELLTVVAGHGHPVVLASSAREDEVDHYLDLLHARDVAVAWTTAADVQATKPEPDLVRAAMERTGTDRAVVIGDSTWDAVAAERAGVPSIGILTGGFSEQELRAAGAAAVFESVEQLIRHLDDTPLAAAAG